MSRSYFEDLYNDDLRRAEWRMLDAALRCRRRHAFRRSLLASVLWVLNLL